MRGALLSVLRPKYITLKDSLSLYIIFSYKTTARNDRP